MYISIIYIYIYIIYIYFVYITYFALMHPYCVSNILQRRKPVDKNGINCCFSSYTFKQNIIFYIEGKAKNVGCCYLTFFLFFVFLSLHFSMFFFSLFSFFNVFCTPPPNQEKHDSK